MPTINRSIARIVTDGRIDYRDPNDFVHFNDDDDLVRLVMFFSVAFYNMKIQNAILTRLQPIPEEPGSMPMSNFKIVTGPTVLHEVDWFRQTVASNPRMEAMGKAGIEIIIDPKGARPSEDMTLGFSQEVLNEFGHLRRRPHEIRCHKGQSFWGMVEDLFPTRTRSVAAQEPTADMVCSRALDFYNDTRQFVVPA